MNKSEMGNYTDENNQGRDQQQHIDENDEATKTNGGGKLEKSLIYLWITKKKKCMTMDEWMWNQWTDDGCWL